MSVAYSLLDHPGVHLADRAEPVITWLSSTTLRYAGFSLTRRSICGPQLVPGGGQPHPAVPVHRAVLVDIAARQLELELGAQPRVPRGRRRAGSPGRPASSSDVDTRSARASSFDLDLLERDGDLLGGRW